MSKNVLFIEDEYADFEYFSKILSGYNIYPQDDIVIDQQSLSIFLRGQTQTGNYQQLKDNVFNYIIEKELYDDKLSFLILDINLLDKDKENKLDESGKKLLRDFKNDFCIHFKDKKGEIEKYNRWKGENENYKKWSGSVWTIALTNFDKNKCRQLESEYGPFMCALNKADIRADNQYLITKLNNMESQRNNDKEYQSQPAQVIKHINTGGGDYNEGDQTKTTGVHSPIITGDRNIVQSYNYLISELIQNHNITQFDANELAQILQDEKQKLDNETFISKMKKWWNKVKGYAINFGVSVFANLLTSYCLLPPEQISLIINAIQ